MTERTYGGDGVTLEILDAQVSEHSEVFGDIVLDLVVHIRGLQDENAKLKAERREFGMLVAEEVTLKCIAAVISGKQMVTADLAAIVEQELAK